MNKALPLLPPFLLLLAGCLTAGRDTRVPAPTGIDAGEVLAHLRQKSDSTQSFQSKGTFLLRTETEKHFVHFEVFFQRPRYLRLDLDLSGPLGFGSGRMTIVEREDSLEVLFPEEEEVVRGAADDERFAGLEEYGLTLADAAYLFAPYTGAVAILGEDQTVAFGTDSRSGEYRLVQKRGDGRREILLVEPESLDLHERRVVMADGEVLLTCRYHFEEEGEGVFVREVESRIHGEETTLRARFRETDLNPQLPKELFRLPDRLP